MGNKLGKYTHTHLRANILYSFASIVALSLLNGCNEPTTFVPTATEQFVYDNRDFYQQPDQVLQADYLIVPDFSYSMRTSKEGLEAALAEFATYLQQEDIDYHVGFARGTSQSRNGESVQQWTNLLPVSFLGGLLTATSGTSAQSLIAEKLSPLAAANAPNEVVILETTKRVIEAQASSFLRQGAQLVYVFISDSDDNSQTLINSNRTTSYYTNALRAQKSHPDYINARAFVTDGSNSCPLLGSANYGFKAGNRLASVASSLDATNDSFRCLHDEDTLADSLKDLANDVSKPISRFAVQANADPGSIEVRVAGSKVNPGPNTWVFKANTNEVVFKPSYADTLIGKSIEITFDMVMKLERSPNLDSMVVTLNGAVVPQSGGSGWSVDTNTLELKFHGGWQPTHGDIILVSYEVN